MELYGRMERALNATGHRTYLKAGWPSEGASDPSNPAFDVPERGAVANDWRVCSDDDGGISTLKRCWDIAAPLWRYAGKGQWNDPGMLVSGSGMTDEQTRTQFNMAAILPAQLMISIDIRNASSYLRATLLNKEVIKVCVRPLSAFSSVHDQKSSRCMCVPRPEALTVVGLLSVCATGESGPRCHPGTPVARGWQPGSQQPGNKPQPRAMQ